MSKSKAVFSPEVQHAEAVPGITPLIRSESMFSGMPTTGRYVVIYKDAVDDRTVKKSLANMAGLRTFALSGDFKEGKIDTEVINQSGAFHFQSLGVAIISGEDEMQSLASSVSNAESPILAIEPEYIAYLSTPEFGQEYLSGYKDAVNQLYEKMYGSGQPSHAEISANFQDSASFTWGLQATGVHTSRYSGQGIRIAVLDTGFDSGHPDFLGRSVSMETFSGSPVQDVHGHGTHCIGTACGSQRPSSAVRRYGIAYNAHIFAGKVFNNAPRPGANTMDVLAGLEWALHNDCHIASLSLGVPLDQKIMQYEAPAQRSLKAGMLIIAAAGNNAQREQYKGFVEPPANADSVMAVGAVDTKMAIAVFSGRSSQATGAGGKVNIAAPGVDVFSSVPVGLGLHSSYNGTSMATPHVAGIAALHAEASGERGAALWNRMARTALSLKLSSEDVGAGLVQAPQ